MAIYIKRNLKEFKEYKMHKSDCLCNDCAIGALIDVLTEQQKHIEELEKPIITGTPISKCCYYNPDCPICPKEQPYTAMRSTGKVETYSLSEKMGLPNRGYVRMPIKPQEYCECQDLLQCNDVKCPNAKYQHCARCDKPYKPIKPQEDIREKIANLINTQFDWERWCMHSGKEEYALADKILAIVKGE